MADAGDSSLSTLPAQEDLTRVESHFEFGANWQRFLNHVTEETVGSAVDSLRGFLQLGTGTAPLAGQTFLDAGCGSGLFSLAAFRLGANVLSFDLDPQSVACTRTLKDRFAFEESEWRIIPGSALDEAFLSPLGQFDVVYSWGVLHHTGAMWDAIDRVRGRVKPGGLFFVALYNDQGRTSERWTAVKEVYQKLPRPLRTPYTLAMAVPIYGPKAAAAAADTLFSLARGKNPVEKVTSNGTQSARGMNRWHDLVDWVGGYPFEVATPDEVLRFLRERDFELVNLNTCGGDLGCNEFLFRASGSPLSS